MIRHLKRNEIDTEKWDRVIRQHAAGSFYPFSWYLDAGAENWSALVDDDYRFIMPLTWKRRFTLHYLYQPLYTQQLGVFGTETVPPDVVRDFLHAIPKMFRFGDLQFNTGNLLGEEGGYEVSDRVNYELHLGESYNDLYRGYSENSRRNLRKACGQELELRTDTGLDELIHFKKELSPFIRNEEHFLRTRDLFSVLASKEKIRIISVRLQGKLCAGALFGMTRGRAVYLFSASSEEGKEARAMFLIIDHFIREHEEQDLILDFEGSNIPSIARFFAGFGARPKMYQQVSFTRLPAYFRKKGKHAG
ncbi:MAG: GNAT family N-acetyltransferase [Bacteroidota bacterium]